MRGVVRSWRPPAARPARLPRFRHVHGERLCASALPHLHRRRLHCDRRALCRHVLRFARCRRRARCGNHRGRPDEPRVGADDALPVTRRRGSLRPRRCQRPNDGRHIHHHQWQLLWAAHAARLERPPRGRPAKRRIHAPARLVQPRCGEPAACVRAHRARHAGAQLLRVRRRRADHLHDGAWRRRRPRVGRHDWLADERPVQCDVLVRAAVRVRLHGPGRRRRRHGRLAGSHHRRPQLRAARNRARLGDVRRPQRDAVRSVGLRGDDSAPRDHVQHSSRRWRVAQVAPDGRRAGVRVPNDVLRRAAHHGAVWAGRAGR